jgi:hypothetical protein
MKKITLLTLFFAITIAANFTNAQCLYYEYDFATKSYVALTDGTKWTNSAWYNIIDIDFEKVTDVTLPQHTGADGRATTTNWGSGYFLTPIYTLDDQLKNVPTGLNWPVKYYLCAFAPNFYGSAYEKIVNNGLTASGNNITCYMNDNSYLPSDVYSKKGFIELSRQSGTTFSKHGYIQIDSIPACERIQWSFSSTGWKRGFKADINYHDGKGWIPLRWMPSDVTNSLTGLAERGYMYEEMIGLEADPSAIISFRVRIWDGDSIHANPTKTDGSVFTAVNSPLAQKQVVRVHQIKVFSGTVPEVAPVGGVPESLYIVSGVKNVEFNGITSRLQNKTIIISETVPAALYSMDGKEIFKGVTDRIDVSNYNKGVYILKTTNLNGLVNSKKIVLY